MEKYVPQNDPFSCGTGGSADAFLSLSKASNSKTVITSCLIYHLGVACEVYIIVGVVLALVFVRQSHVKTALFDMQR